MKAFIYARSLSLPFLIVIGFYAGGWWNFITPVACFCMHPILNLLLTKNTSPLNEPTPEPTDAYRFIELMYVPVIIGLSVWAWYQGSLLQGPAFFGLALSVGLINGILGFTLAHELIHRTEKTIRATGYLLLLNNFYMHYGLEHVWGHHVYASTSKDPHTARKGQSFYAYLPWAIRRTFMNACEIEKRKLKKRNLPWLTMHNKIFGFLFLQLLVLTSIVCLLGWASIGFYLIQISIAIILLHAVNYLQHYGLLRKKTNDGHIERMNEHHAWHSGNRINHLSLFQLENHAHHHMHPAHPYENLKHTAGSPEYPTGYSGMILLAMIPPLWFRIVHKRFPLHH